MSAIICTIIICLTLVALALIYYPNITKLLQIKDQNSKNELYKMYSSINIHEIDQMIDFQLEAIVKRWVLVNITTQNGNYMKQDDVNECIRFTTSKFVSECSELYLFYIKLLTTITSDEDLIRFVRNKVKDIVLDFVVKFNA